MTNAELHDAVASFIVNLNTCFNINIETIKTMVIKTLSYFPGDSKIWSTYEERIVFEETQHFIKCNKPNYTGKDFDLDFIQILAALIQIIQSL